MKFSKLSFLIAAVFAVPFAHAEVIVDTETTIRSTESVEPAGGVIKYTSTTGNNALNITQTGSYTVQGTLISNGIGVSGNLKAGTILIGPDSSKQLGISGSGSVTAVTIGSAEQTVKANQTGGTIKFENGYFNAFGIKYATLESTRTLDISTSLHIQEASTITANEITGTGSVSVADAAGNLTANSVKIYDPNGKSGQFSSAGTVNVTNELSANGITIRAGTTSVGSLKSADWLQVSSQTPATAILKVTNEAVANQVRVYQGGTLKTGSLVGLNEGPLTSVEVMGELKVGNGELSSQKLILRETGKINADAGTSTLEKLTLTKELWAYSDLSVSNFNMTGNLYNYANLSVDKIGTAEAPTTGAITNYSGGTITVAGDVFTTNSIDVTGNMTVAGTVNFGGGYQELNINGESSNLTANNLVLNGMLGLNHYDPNTGSVTIKENVTVENEGHLIVETGNIEVGNALVVNDGAKVQLRNKADNLTFKNVVLNTNENSWVQVYARNTFENLTVNGVGTIQTYLDKDNPSAVSKFTVQNLAVNENASLNFVDRYTTEGLNSTVEIQTAALKTGSTLGNIGNTKGPGFSDLNIGTLTAESATIQNGENGVMKIDSLASSDSSIVNGTNGNIQIGSLSGSNNTITLSDLEKAQVVIGQNHSEGLVVTTSLPGFADSIDGNDIRGGLQQLADTVVLNSTENSNGFKVVAGESAVLGTLSGDTDGKGTVIGVKEEVNTVSRSVVDIASTNYMFFRTTINDVAARLGDLRSMPKTAGLWARYYGGKEKDSSRHLSSRYNTLQMGADAFIHENFYLGAAFSYIKNDGSLMNGSSDDKNFNFGVYGGWLGNSGQYVDAIFKVHRIKTDFSLYNNMGRHSSSFDTWGTSFSAEAGWRLQCPTNGFYVEPQAELMLGRVNSVDYKTSQGVTVKQDRVDSVIGRAGVAVGYTFPAEKGNVYALASVLHDWKGKVNAEFSAGAQSRKVKDDLSGTWGEFALGGTVNPTKHISAYTQVKTSAGSPVRNPWQVSIGMRYSF